MTGVASGSNITLIDGNEKPIENMRAGDDILVYDFQNERVMFSRVAKISAFKTDGVEIATARGRIVSSPDHMFFVSENGDKKAASDLRIGDEILAFDFFLGRKERILEKSSAQNSSLYDLAVHDYKNFVANGFMVSASGI